MSATKYWGDERHDDAIYAVYLKKVRYVPPLSYEGLPHYRPIDPDVQHLAAQIDTPNHLQWETVQERVIKAGTLGRLVESVINAEDSRMDSRQFNVFFATFRAFAEPEAVLAKFMEWYEVVSSLSTSDAAQPSTSVDASQQWTMPKCPSTLLNTIRSILICWLDMYPEDFYALNVDGKFFLLVRLVDFARSRSLYDLKHKARKIWERFRRVAEEGGLPAQIPSLARYSYENAVCYDPHDVSYARHRAQMFDISRDNCVQIAEQLTFWDAVLFRELRSYQCLGAIWGRRHKDKADAVYSVRATVDQFNAVSQRVMTSIVFPECTPEFRAKIMEKWIDIARELRALKNFSSLKAIVSSLQSEPVFRLKSAWTVVSKVSVAQFKQLAAIFDADENGEESKIRSILEAEGTAKSSPFKRSPAVLSPAGGLSGALGGSNCRRTKSDVNLAADAQGTVPFLGTFLTDLTMIDQAHEDTTPEGLINFEKHRREFEVLAKIRLFQSAASAYTVPMDQAFCIWFYYLPSINEKDCFTRSLEVEPAVGAVAAMSTSKFYSLTKMFANAATESPPNGYDRKLAAWIAPQDQQRLPHSSTTSFIEQRSNDSGIHTEASTVGQNGRLADDFADEPLPGSGLSRIDVDATRRLSESVDYGCEFNSNDQFGASTPSADSPTTARQSETRFADLSAKRKNSDTPFWRRPQSNLSHRHQRDRSTDDRPSMSSAMAGGFNTSTHYRPQQLTVAAAQHNTVRHMKSVSSSSSCSSSFGASGGVGSANDGSGRSATKSRLPPTTASGTPGKDFHLARVGLDDSVFGEIGADASNINYKCIKVENDDRMTNLVARALEKHMIDTAERANVYLVQLLPNGSEFKLPDHCNPFYAVAPDPTSPMLNFLLKKRQQAGGGDASADSSLFSATSALSSDASSTRGGFMAPSAKKLNKQKRSNLLRWSSGYL